MKSDCVAFSAIPHSSRLFLDFLSHSPNLAPFYPRTADTSWALDEARNLRFDAVRRARVAEVLERQNRAYGASETTLSNIERLRKGAVAAVSGQQVGLFGGPLYSLLKAASAIRLAQDLTRQGIEAIPVFWLATEDHDLAEVNHALLADARGELTRLTSISAGVTAAPVAQVSFGPEIEDVVARACALLGEGEVADALRDSYRPGENYGSAYAKLFSRLTREHGVVMLDPIDREWHEIAKPILREAIERAAELDDALLARGKKLREAEYHEQVKVTDESTLLFAFDHGERRVIHRANGEFTIGKTRLTKDALLQRIDDHPEEFSPNVLLRPVMQDYLLPTVAYFGGPAEIAYFAQVAVVYEKVLGRVTPIVPRLSVTLVDTRMERFLKRYSLNMPDLFHGGEHLRECLAARVLPAELQQDLARTEQELSENLSAIRSALEKLDKTLVEALERSSRKMLYQLGKIKTKAARAELRRNQQLNSDAQAILGLLFPERNLQERELSGIQFLAQHGVGLLDTLVLAAGTHCPGHQILYL